MPEMQQMVEMLEQCTLEQRKEIFERLRKEFKIHPIEVDLNVQAEVILEAIRRSSDLTLRGIRGIIAEASFDMNVASKLVGWTSAPLAGDPAYDCLLEQGGNKIRIQVKMQRLISHRPMMASEAFRRLPADMYVVETQRTRGGKDSKTGDATRPYRFGEFDILAVSLHPSTNDWSKFRYTLERWLLPDPTAPDCLLKFQPIPTAPNEDWTDDLTVCIQWFQSLAKKTIRSTSQ